MKEMTNRERIINCALNKPIDRSPFTFYFGPWWETTERWKKENGKGPNAWQEGFGLDQSAQLVGCIINQLHYPAFVFKQLEKHGDVLICEDYLGQIVECIEGKSGIPKILKSPVGNREEWEALKKARLNPDDEGRFPENWSDLVKILNATDAPVQVGIYPCGLYGTLRDLMGVEGSLFAFYDDPELVHDIFDYLTDFWIKIYTKVRKDVKIDIIHIWEDMSGKQGSLISPDMIREFMLPYYRRLKEFADANDIPIVQVDTDGNCEEMIPLFAEAGVNMMLPFEVAAGCDINELRRKYPEMSMMGGIDKMEIAKGKEAIDKELERIKPLLNKSGYFPALDHLIPPDISYDDYYYFVNKLKDMIFNPEKESE
ncbi:MAG: uroporphyrinogen decarboxylase family protein [Saccharofermentanales bacterium]